MFAALDWLPTFVDIAGGSKGDELRKQIEAGKYPGIVKTTLDGFDQRDYLEGKSETSARDVFFYYSGSTPSAVRYKNWKMYYNMAAPGAEGWILPLVPFHMTLVQNIKRDPFEQAVGGRARRLSTASAVPSAARLLPTYTIGTCCRSVSSFGIRSLCLSRSFRRCRHRRLGTLMAS